MALDLFSSLKSFTAIAEYGGFANAARHINVSTPVLTKQIKWLEQLLGTTLFHRTTRRIQLTEAGELYLVHAKKILQQIQQANQDVISLDQEPHGKLTIGLPAAFDSRLFTRLFKIFLDKHAKITLHVIGENSSIALINGIADLIISTMNLLDKQFIKQHIYTGTRNVYAAPDYISKHGCPHTIADLKNHNCLVNTRVSPNHEWEFANHQSVVINGNYVTDSGVDIIFAGVNGIGLIYATDLLVREEVMAGELVEVKLEVEPIAIALYLYYRPAAHGSNIRLLADYLQQVTTAVS